MRVFFISVFMLAANFATATTPTNGWYTSIFGGYAHPLDNINTSRAGPLLNNSSYHSGFDTGGNIGFKSNPMRYEGELTYLDANLKKFNVNGVNQTGIRGYSDAVLAMANIYYDFNGIAPSLQPFLGGGIGYGWVNAKLNSTGPFSIIQYTGSNNVFTYQATAGLTYNLAKNYALNLGYRYIATTNADQLGKSFQANLANLGATYRFDEARDK